VVVTFAAVAVAIPAAHAQAKHDVGTVQPATAQGTKLVNGAPVRSYLRLPRDLPSDDQEALRHPGSVAIGGYSPSALGKRGSVRTSEPVAAGTSDTFRWGDAFRPWSPPERTWAPGFGQGGDYGVYGNTMAPGFCLERL
jgi:hypothetical protein